MAISIRSGKVNWVQDLNGSTSATPLPTASTAGVVPAYPGGCSGSNVHIGVDYTVASGTLSLTVSVYGYTQTGTFPGWKFLGQLNNASSMAVDTTRWSPNTSQITMAEIFSCSGENYERYATRSIPGGTSPVVSTYVGFPTE